METVTTLDLKADELPLKIWDDGMFRVGDTRILLDLVVSAHNRGETPEHIVEMYDVLELADTYAVIGFYLRHKVVLDSYFQRREAEAQILREKIEREQGYNPARERVLSSRRKRETAQ